MEAIFLVMSAIELESLASFRAYRAGEEWLEYED